MRGLARTSMCHLSGESRLRPTQDALHRLHIGRHYGCSPLPSTPRAVNGRRVPAGLLARGSSARLQPSHRGAVACTTVALMKRACRLQLRGQPRLWMSAPRVVHVCVSAPGSLFIRSEMFFPETSTHRLHPTQMPSQLRFSARLMQKLARVVRMPQGTGGGRKSGIDLRRSISVSPQLFNGASTG